MTPMQVLSNLILRCSNFLGTLSQYGTILKLIAVDSIWRFKKESFLILITGFLGVSFQLWTFGLAIYYAKALEKGEVVKLLGYEFQTRTSTGLLYLCGIGALLSLLLSAWLIYFSRTKSFALRRKYEEFCSKRALSLFGSSLKVWAPPNKIFSDNNIIFTIARNDSRNSSKVLWILLDTIVPGITLLVSICILFYINTPLTFLILVIFGISSVFLYKINVMGAKNSALKEKHARGATLEYQQIILRQKGTASPLPEDESWFREKVFTSGKIKRYLDAYIGRLRAIENSQLVSNVLFAVTIFAIFLTLGTDIIKGGKGWGNLIVYLVALRFGLVNLKQLSKQITGISRFYPQIRRYFQFLENTGTPSANNQKPSNYMIQATLPRLDGSMESLDLHKGSKIGLISTVELNRYTLAFIIDCLLGHSQHMVNNALGSMWFVTSKYGCFPGSLKESLGLPPGYTWQDLHKEIADTGLLNKLEEQLSRDLEKPISYEAWDRIGPDVKFTLALLNAIRSNCEWIVLEENGLRLLPDSARKYFMDRISDRIIVIVFYGNIDTMGTYSEDVMAVMSNANIIGLGSVGWFIENQRKISDLSGRITSKELEKVYREIDSDDDFDDEDF